MELQAVDGILLMADGHDFTIFRMGQDFQFIRQGIRVEGQGMIAADVDLLRQSLEQGAVRLQRGDGLFAVHELLGIGNGTAVDFADGLMT